MPLLILGSYQYLGFARPRIRYALPEPVFHGSGKNKTNNHRDIGRIVRLVNTRYFSSVTGRQFLADEFATTHSARIQIKCRLGCISTWVLCCVGERESFRVLAIRKASID